MALVRESTPFQTKIDIFYYIRYNTREKDNYFCKSLRLKCLIDKTLHMSLKLFALRVISSRWIEWQIEDAKFPSVSLLLLKMIMASIQENMFLLNLTYISCYNLQILYIKLKFHKTKKYYIKNHTV